MNDGAGFLHKGTEKIFDHNRSAAEMDEHESLEPESNFTDDHG
jgi:hypothetical protein